MKLMIIDYGMGNLHSVYKAIEACGGSPQIIDSPLGLKDASHIILPGVGAFADAMYRLREKGWHEALLGAQKEGIPLLGICLGMQLLFDKGYENGENEGLGLIEGQVIKFESSDKLYRIPHVGWNDVNIVNKSMLLNNIPQHSDFYFVHSYYASLVNEAHVIGKTQYCQTFPSVVAKEMVMGTQFHPEKSGKNGFKILKNFLEM